MLLGNWAERRADEGASVRMGPDIQGGINMKRSISATTQTAKAKSKKRRRREPTALTPSTGQQTRGCHFALLKAVVVGQDSA